MKGVDSGASTLGTDWRRDSEPDHESLCLSGGPSTRERMETDMAEVGGHVTWPAGGTSSGAVAIRRGLSGNRTAAAPVRSAVDLRQALCTPPERDLQSVALKVRRPLQRSEKAPRTPTKKRKRVRGENQQVPNKTNTINNM